MYVLETPSSKKIVLLLSSMHGDKSLASSRKPTVIQDYNKKKGGVDTFDQLCSQYLCGRKTNRWPLCVFFGMLNASAINSWIIHGENMQKTSGTQIERKQFM